MKIGGSVITEKNRPGVFIRRKLLNEIAKDCAAALSANKNTRLIIIHGAGSAAHQVAKKYNLENGIKNDFNKIEGALAIHVANQKLNLAIAEIFLKHGVNISPVHTASAVIQNNGIIEKCFYDVIDGVLNLNCVPLLYGEIVFDRTLGMTICSGDAIAVDLVKKYNASKLVFASDVDGIFDKDPHVHRDAKIVRLTTLDSISKSGEVALSGSHNVDVTGGLKNKIAVLSIGNIPKSLKQVVVCNGFNAGFIGRAFNDTDDGTIIKI